MSTSTEPATIRDPIGCNEVAELIGVKRSTVDQMRFRSQSAPSDKTLPEPDAIVSTTLIWSRATIVEWAKRVGRLPADFE